MFIDWSQNDAAKTTISVYPCGPGPGRPSPPPLTWEEVEKLASDGADPDDYVFDAPALLDRVDSVGDLFAPLNQFEQSLPSI